MKKLATFILFYIVLLPTPTWAEALKDRFATAKGGDYVVCEINHSYNLLRIHENKGDTLLIEELTLPSTPKLKGTRDWETWLKNGAEGHTSWILIEVALKDGTMQECFSFTRNAWLKLSENDSFLLKLLELPLSPLPHEDRKKIGAKPLRGEDFREEWSPPQFIDGKRIKNPKFDVYRINWPKDGTPLAAKSLDFYFDQDQPTFPFPYWGRVTETINTAMKFRVVDSGHNLYSPTKDIPRRPMSIHTHPTLNENGLQISISAPPYYKGLELYATNFSASTPETTDLPFSLSREGEITQFTVPLSQVREFLKEEHEYIFMIMANEPSYVSLETRTPFIITKIDS